MGLARAIASALAALSIVDIVFPFAVWGDSFAWSNSLAQFGDDRLGSAFLAEIGQEKKRPRQTFLTRIEELIDQILFDPADHMTTTLCPLEHMEGTE
jgi:hypothetical protein